MLIKQFRHLKNSNNFSIYQCILQKLIQCGVLITIFQSFSNNYLTIKKDIQFFLSKIHTAFLQFLYICPYPTHYLMKIALASDHAGYELKLKLAQYLSDKKIEVTDLGSDSAEPSDYPEFGHEIAKHIEQGKSDFGISLCGSGNGINMTANKYPYIRSALCWNIEIASLARKHNNANICALPARFITLGEAKKIVDIFIHTSFEGGRHQRRIEKIPR